MTPTAEKLFETENLLLDAVAIGYDVDPEELEVKTIVQPLVADAAFELVATVTGPDVAACIAGRGETFEEAVNSLHAQALKARREAKNVRASKPAPRPQLRLVHSA